MPAGGRHIKAAPARRVRRTKHARRGEVGWACLSGAQRSEFAQPPRLACLVKGSLAAQAAGPDDRAGAALI